MGKKERKIKVNKRDIVFYALLVLYLVSGVSYSMHIRERFASLEERIALLEEKITSNQPSTIRQPQTSWENDCDKELNGEYDGVFIYMATCPHCNRMKPLVEASNMNWYWIDAVDTTCRELNWTKFGFKGFVPHFYCTRTGESHTGAMREEDFNEWVMSCVGG